MKDGYCFRRSGGWTVALICIATVATMAPALASNESLANAFNDYVRHLGERFAALRYQAAMDCPPGVTANPQLWQRFCNEEGQLPYFQWERDDSPKIEKIKKDIRGMWPQLGRIGGHHYLAQGNAERALIAIKRDIKTIEAKLPNWTTQLRRTAQAESQFRSALRNGAAADIRQTGQTLLRRLVRMDAIFQDFDRVDEAFSKHYYDIPVISDRPYSVERLAGSYMALLQFETLNSGAMDVFIGQQDKQMFDFIEAFKTSWQHYERLRSKLSLSGSQSILADAGLTATSVAALAAEWKALQPRAREAASGRIPMVK